MLALWVVVLLLAVGLLFFFWRSGVMLVRKAYEDPKWPRA